MEYRKLGPSGTVVSVHCLGTMTFGAESDEATSFRLLDDFFAAGGNFVDTADVYSAGVASASIVPKLDERKVAALVCLAGAALAAFTPITRYESFLYFISSVFAPMAAVLVVDYFVFASPGAKRRFNVGNLAVWTVGFVLYRGLLAHGIETSVGLTVPVMAATATLALIAGRFRVSAPRV